MKTIKIEALYPEINNLFGDTGNVLYLEKKLKAAGFNVEITSTHLFEKPAFVDSDIDILYIGPSKEKDQFVEIEELKKYKADFEKRIESDKLTLVTGNAFEIFGSYIEDTDGEKHDCLSIYDTYAKRFSRLRFNDNCVGEFNGMQIVGYKNLLSHSYGELSNEFLNMIKGAGMSPESKIEGFHKNSFYATYHTGPILPLNPDFTEYLLKNLIPEYKDVRFKYEDTAKEARLKELLK